MTGGMDYSGFLQLKRQIETMAAGFDGFIRGFLLKQGLDALAKTKKNTPVDTGMLRNSWELGDSVTVLKASKSKGKTIWKKASDAPFSQNASLAGVVRKGDTLEITIYNPAEYASFVEYGHLTANRKDWVEGYFMCTLAIEDVQRRIPGRWNKEFAAWCRGLGADVR